MLTTCVVAARRASNFYFLGSCEWQLQLRIPELRRALSNFKQLRSCVQLANCTKSLYFSCKNFVILPYVKSLDKIKNL